MENMSSDSEARQSPEQAGLTLTPRSETRIHLWQRTGSFPYPGLQVVPSPNTHDYSKDELRLIHHVTSISNELLLNGATHMTVWTRSMPK